MGFMNLSVIFVEVWKLIKYFGLIFFLCYLSYFVCVCVCVCAFFFFFFFFFFLGNKKDLMIILGILTPFLVFF
jgi:hypothetical protein